MQKFDGGVIWFYSEKSAVPSRQLPGAKKFRFNEGLPADFGNTKDKPYLIIVEDLLNEAYSKDVSDLFMKGSHHRNISVIPITQNLFH